MQVQIAQRVVFANSIQSPDFRHAVLVGEVDSNFEYSAFDSLHIEIRNGSGDVEHVIDLPAGATVEDSIHTLDTFAKVSFIR